MPCLIQWRITDIKPLIQKHARNKSALVQKPSQQKPKKKTNPDSNTARARKMAICGEARESGRVATSHAPCVLQDTRAGVLQGSAPGPAPTPATSQDASNLKNLRKNTSPREKWGHFSCYSQVCAKIAFYSHVFQKFNQIRKQQATFSITFSIPPSIAIVIARNFKNTFLGQNGKKVRGPCFF